MWDLNMKEQAVYRKLVDWNNIEIPCPGKEAIVGFAITFAGCLLLHFSLLWLCWILASG
jgi:hypothetical protein